MVQSKATFTSTVNSCAQSVGFTCAGSEMSNSPTKSDLIYICLEHQHPPTPPKLTKMSSLTLRDGIRHDPSLQGAQISTICQCGLNGGCLSGQEGGIDY